MRGFVRGLGLLLVVLGLATGVAELLFALTQDDHETLALGTIWYRLHPNSLVGFQGLIERSLGAPVGTSLWAGLRAFLSWPAWLTLTVPGVLLMLLGRGEERRGGFG